MSKASDKLAAVEQLLSDREEKLRKKLTLTSIIYAVLVLFTAGYTLLIIPLIKKKTSPDAASEYAIAWALTHMSNVRINTGEQLRENSQELSKTIVKQTIELIPKFEEPLLGVVNNSVNYIVDQIEVVLIPAFTKALQKNSDELKRSYKDFEDEEKMQGLALVLVEILEKELDLYINEAFIKEVFELKKRLLELGKPGVELTKKEIAQRDVLINWIYLSNNQATGGSAFYDLVERMKTEVNNLIHDEKKDEEIDGVGVIKHRRIIKSLSIWFKKFRKLIWNEVYTKAI